MFASYIEEDSWKATAIGLGVPTTEEEKRRFENIVGSSFAGGQREAVQRAYRFDRTLTCRNSRKDCMAG